MELNVIQKDDFADQSACLRCVKDGGGCCTGKGSGIFVTLHDVMRIAKKNGMPLDKIAYFEKVDSGHLKGITETDPFFASCFRDGKTLQLQRENEMCQFLAPGKGCEVFESRPAICRMFPFTFDFTKEGKPRIVVPKAEKRKWEECTIIEENYYRSKGATLKAMNSNKEKMMELVVQSINEMKQFSVYIDDLANGMSLSDIIEKHGLSLV